MHSNIHTVPPQFYLLPCIGMEGKSVAASANNCRTTYLCKHCNRELLKKAYERHRRLYLNEETNQWILNSDHIYNDDGDSEEPFDSDIEIDCEDNNYVPPPPIVTFDEINEATMEFDPPPDMHGA